MFRLSVDAGVAELSVLEAVELGMIMPGGILDISIVPESSTMGSGTRFGMKRVC